MLSFLEISRENLVHNFAQISSLVSPGVKIAAVIKANAYGHGQNEVAVALEKHADYFQVDDIEELRLLRKISDKETLVLGYVAKEDLAEAVELGGILGVYDAARLEILDRIAGGLGKEATVHLKLDACLGRQGVLEQDLADFIVKLKKLKNIRLEGVYSHFANIEDTGDFSHAQKQLDAFERMCGALCLAGYEGFRRHISASSGVMVYEKSLGRSDIVRPGISLYGMWPSGELEEKYKGEDLSLRAALRWVSHLAQVKNIPQGYSVGYGLTFVAPKDMKIAIVPQGYSDGFDRGLSNCGEVLIHGKRCPVIGRVAMNMFAVDVSDLREVKAEDEVVLLGQQGGERISAEEIAQKLGTINYEITTRISPLLPRILT